MAADRIESQSSLISRPTPRSSWVASGLAEATEARSRGVVDAIETIFTRHPQWDDEDKIRLIYEDLCERRERGEEVATREVVDRFPEYRDELALLLDFDRIVRENVGTITLPQVGECLGPFSLVEELGRGASGRAYLARDTSLADRFVVLKIQPIHQDEHLTLAQLQNTHIIPIFSEHTFRDRGLRTICMPYLGGGCLDRLLDDLAEIPLRDRKGIHLLTSIDRIQPRRLDHLEFGSPYRHYLEHETWTRTVCWIAACLADAIHGVHARGMIHMDIKPSNVLIAGDGLPLLLDFHLARRPLQSGEFVTGRLGGTPGWMSPEQALTFEAASLGQPVPSAVDGRCDIHSLGLLIATTLEGKKEPRELSWTDSSWSPENREVSPGLTDIIRRCLESDPASRYQSAASLADDLRRHLDDLPLKEAPNRSIHERWRKWRRRRPGALTRLAIGSVGFGMILATLMILGNDHFRRLADSDENLAIGRALMAKREHAEAVVAFSRGLSRIVGPLDGGRSNVLRSSLEKARLGLMVDELHRQAETVRFRFGVDPPDPSTTHMLTSVFPTIWKSREMLLDWGSRSGDSVVSERVRTDLIELVSIWADARVRSSSKDDTRRVQTDSLALLEEAVASCGRSASLRRQIRELRQSLGLSDNSISTESPQPTDAWEQYDLGRYYLRAGKFDEAFAQFENASRERPQDFWPVFNLGICAYHLGQFHEAAEAFRVCEALSPTSGECSYNHALALEAEGRFERAWSEYSRAISIAPQLSAAWLNRGILSFRRGDNAAAIADYQEAIRRAVEPELRLKAEESLRLAARRSGRNSINPIESSNR